MLLLNLPIISKQLTKNALFLSHIRLFNREVFEKGVVRVMMYSRSFTKNLNKVIFACLLFQFSAYIHNYTHVRL